ncbi:MAG: DinB family protein [Blastocatellia bacterium]|nr:DinB family protein [Blastocatellia bacterium]
MTETKDNSTDNLDEQMLLGAWHTTHRVTMYLIENLPPELWPEHVPGNPRRTVRTIAAHIHNARCMWIKMLGVRHGIVVPRRVDVHSVGPPELLRELERSSEGIAGLIRLGAARGGVLPPADWQNFPTDVVHFLSYFVAHEAHHRGQLSMLARQLGHRLPAEVTAGLWQWKKRSRE